MNRHLLVVGAQRCGTTYLHDVLAAHPQVAMARPVRPEPKVFLRPGPVDLASYVTEFFGHAGDDDVLGEKSTSYLEVPEVPDRVAATLGSPQILVQLRDPVARAVSNWSFSRDHGVETRPLAEALRADLTGGRSWDRAGSSVSPFAYVARGRYVEDLDRWVGRFDVRVQFLEDLLADSEVTAGLYRWLGVDDGFRPDLGDDPVNASTSVPDEVDDELVAELREHYRASDAALADLLGRDLPWHHLDHGAPEEA
ncbi:MAG: sulfotransferase family protein [Nocardioides sp.]